MWGTPAALETVHDLRRFIPTHVGNSSFRNESMTVKSVHPHACGELVPISEYAPSTGGSSPRMWGTHIWKSLQPHSTRFIPTHVGNSYLLRETALANPVHPHACGELATNTTGTTWQNGSSPRMWGTLPIKRHDNLRYLVHPHACGELVSCRKLARPWTGSSPRMWGTHAQLRITTGQTRFIPTHVGNSSPVKTWSDINTVHPHACGELYIRPIIVIRTIGSSPRMWGTLHAKHVGDVEVRFIPTHVGNSTFEALNYHTPTVHPHACGELHHREHRPDRGLRFIPTHVGNSSMVALCGSPASVHPHACGELITNHVLPDSRAGSSPRMWGTRRAGRCGAAAPRFIPTHVGNSSHTLTRPLFDPVHPHACGELSS